MLTQARLKELLNYNQDTGDFVWVPTFQKTKVSGKVAGTVDQEGYRHIGIDYKHYAAHRLAWLYVYGDLPTCMIDHIDNNPANNRISNLRLCTGSQNQANRGPIKRGSKSGIKGVYQHHRTKKWQVVIGLNRKLHYIGIYDSLEDATAARMIAAEKFHGEFAKHV